jgi:hypothetical protein
VRVNRDLPNEAAAVPTVRHLIDELLGGWPAEARQTV